MPSVQHPLDRVMRGTEEFGVIRRGDIESLYNKVQINTYTSAGSATYTAPDWATYLYVVASGGGRGGNAGNGGNNTAGKGGRAGALVDQGFWIGETVYVTNRTAAITVGAGGSGGSSSGAQGNSGGLSRFNPAWVSDILTAAGATVENTVQDGDRESWAPVTQIPAYLPKYVRNNITNHVAPYTPQVAGTGNGGNASSGGGGAGGNGGYFNQYTSGGWGGAGFVRIVAWGYDPYPN